MDFSNTALTAGLVAGAAAIGAFWQQARGFLQYISSFVLLQRTLDFQASLVVFRYLRKQYKPLPSGISRIETNILRLESHGVLGVIPFKLPPLHTIWVTKFGVFYLTSSRTLTIVSPRFLSRPEKLIQEATLQDLELRKASSSSASSFYVEKIIGTAGERISRGQPIPRPDSTREDSRIDGGEKGAFESPILGVDKSFVFPESEYIQNSGIDPMRGLFFQPEVHELMAKCQNWYKNREWYAQHSIPWRMGILLHGPGGTGKSSLARVLAQTLGVPLYQYYLNTLSDREFVSNWSRMQTPCVVALEDFDTVFHGRESATEHKSLSFEAVLNEISGVTQSSGVLLVVTTNNFEMVDPAMGRLDEEGRPTRPGRIDHILHMGATTLEQRQGISQHILGGWADELIPDLLQRGVGTMAAQFQSMCVQAAMQKLTEMERA